MNMATKAKKTAARKAPAKKPGRKTPEKRELSPTERLDKFGIEAVCDAIKSGAPMRVVAAKVPVEPEALRKWLADDDTRSVRAREARSAAAFAYDEIALQGISDAKDPFELAKAKEEAHHLRWRASKINPQYGDKVALGGDPDTPPIRSESTVILSPEESYKRMLGGG